MLSEREFQLYAQVAAALAGATAADGLADGAGHAHRIQDAAMHHVREYRTRLQAHRLLKRKAKLRAQRIRSRRTSR